MNDFFLTRVRYSRLRIKNDLFMWYSFVFLIFTLKSRSVQSQYSVKNLRLVTATDYFISAFRGYFLLQHG